MTIKKFLVSSSTCWLWCFICLLYFYLNTVCPAPLQASKTSTQYTVAESLLSHVAFWDLVSLICSNSFTTTLSISGIFFLLEVRIYEFGSRNLRHQVHSSHFDRSKIEIIFTLQYVFLTWEALRWETFNLNKLPVKYRYCIQWFHHVSNWHACNSETRSSRKIQFPACNYDVHLVNTIFPTWLERTIS